MRPGLTKRQIAAQHSETRGAERIRQRNQQRRLAIGSSAVRENQAARFGVRGAVQKPPNWRVFVG